jgi:hypothetical protein
MTITTEYTAQEDNYYLPIEVTEGGVRCGNHYAEWKVRHENVAAVRACYAITADLEAEARAECYGEAVMSWVCGGGNPADAGRYASVVASGGTWNGGIDESPLSGKLCDHGLALELCADPVSHYPLDM